MSSKPNSGIMVYWRFKERAPCTWRFGYVTHTDNNDIVRMGSYNGQVLGATPVSWTEIEWKPYNDN